MQPSKAIEIPEELSKHILSHAAKHDICPPTLSKEEERHAQACALVCRHSVPMCRPPLLGTITPCTPDDAKGFRGILDLPPLPGLLPVADLPRHLIAV